jgi:soluble lytic murein transglycosylase-like protein
MVSRVPAMMERITVIKASLAGLTATPERTRPPGFAATLDAAAESSGVRPDGREADGGFDDIIQQAAERNKLNPDLIHAVIRAESDYNPRCRSSAGAMGLMQLMPGTARGLGVTDPWDPAQNIQGGACYLRRQLDRFGDLTLALAAYNAGPGAVERYDGVPPYDETQTYVQRVQRYLHERTAAR